jgi:hypothetical protein
MPAIQLPDFSQKVGELSLSCVCIMGFDAVGKSRKRFNPLYLVLPQISIPTQLLASQAYTLLFSFYECLTPISGSFCSPSLTFSGSYSLPIGVLC